MTTAQRKIRINPLPGRGGTIAPFFRVTIGENDLFQTGDGHLRAAEVSLNEGENASNCRFEIYDPGRKFTEKYFAYIFEIGGLEPLTPPQQAGGGSVAAAGKFNGDLPANLNGADPERVRKALAYYKSQGLSDRGAAYLVGNMIQESTMEAGAEATDQGTGYSSSEGLIQWTFERKEGMPATFDGQLEFALTEMERDGGGQGLRQVLSDPNASEADVRAGLQRWIRWGDEGNRFGYGEELYQAMQKGNVEAAQPANVAKDSVQAASNPPQEQVPKSTSNAGSQITIELGFAGQVIAAYSFLHTSLDFSLFDPDVLVFGGQSAQWVLTQRIKNTAYQNISLKQLAQKVCSAYGLTLDMPEDGPTYEYFPQRGQTDYEMLMIEARRIGMRVHCKGNTLSIKSRQTDFQGFVLEYGDGMGLSFKVRHQAQTDSSGGARSSTPGASASTGQRKTEVDPDTGVQKVERPENPVGTGDGATTVTTGADTPQNKPKTTGTTDAQDKTRKEGELRIKGITAEFEMPTTPEALLLDPDTPLLTKGVSDFLDRIWVVESVAHRFGLNGAATTGSLYTPMKSKFPPPAPGQTATGPVPPLNPGGFIKPMQGTVTSRFQTAERPNHQGIDIANGGGTSIVSSADGVVIDVQDGCVVGDQGCGGGYGNLVFIQHAGGYESRYCHLQNGSVKVSIGQQVKQGEQIGAEGDTGHSYGHHLHHEIRLNGAPTDPLSHYSE